jgi:MOSC domain-containing protein YiiM
MIDTKASASNGVGGKPDASIHVHAIHSSKGGVPKRARMNDFVGRLGLSSDKQAHPQFHGGPERAVCLYSLERIEALRDEGHAIKPGSTGENLTLVGLDWDRVKPGLRLQIGETLSLEITSFAAPCKSIRASFKDEDFSRIAHHLRPGWSRAYARVLSEGEVAVMDRVRIEGAVLAD